MDTETKEMTKRIAELLEQAHKAATAALIEVPPNLDTARNNAFQKFARYSRLEHDLSEALKNWMLKVKEGEGR